jgi:hypothetical protein
MDTETADQKLKKLDLILVSCLLFDIVNVVLYVHSLINYSFLHILTIFCIGFANILFAFLVYLRIRDPNYKLLYGEEGISQSRYYVKTMFKGALFIALDFALVTVLLWICSIMSPNGAEAAMHHCSASIEPSSNADAVGHIQYLFDNFACKSGNSKFLSFISINQDNFLIVVLNRLISENLRWGVWWTLTLYSILMISLVPFVWLIVRCVHGTFAVFKRKIMV